MEGDAGARQLNPIGAQDSTEPDPGVADRIDAQLDSAAAPDPSGDAETDLDDDAAQGPPSRLGRRWFVAICAALLLATAGAGVAGYLALRFHQDSERLAAIDDAAVRAAMDCVAATQAPDTAAMAAGQGKILDCTTGNFGAQAVLFSGVLVDAFRAANVNIAVSEMRAAVEGHNPDGSVRVLVALRTKVTNSEQSDREQGWRLRVQMAPVDGTFKIADLQQVTS